MTMAAPRPGSLESNLRALRRHGGWRLGLVGVFAVIAFGFVAWRDGTLNGVLVASVLIALTVMVLGALYGGLSLWIAMLARRRAAHREGGR